MKSLVPKLTFLWKFRHTKIRVPDGKIKLLKKLLLKKGMDRERITWTLIDKQQVVKNTWKLEPIKTGVDQSDRSAGSGGRTRVIRSTEMEALGEPHPRTWTLDRVTMITWSLLWFEFITRKRVSCTWYSTQIPRYPCEILLQVEICKTFFSIRFVFIKT